MSLKPYHRLRTAEDVKAHTTSSTFTPMQLARLYNFPAADGTGQKIGILEFGGGYVRSDITQYFTNLGITVQPNVTAVSYNGATNDPSDTSGANIEVILDIEVIAAIVPKADIRVYFAPNSFDDFYGVLNQAITDGCTIISISWGAPEVYWDTTLMNRFSNLCLSASNAGVTITAASGDNGSSDGESGNNADFPASCPWVIACGGTTLTADTNRTAITREVVWNSGSGATGGGVSQIFAKPAYQSGLSVAKRGVPDMCANADPETGYQLYSASVGGQIVVGGTSAVAPLVAGLIARCNQLQNASANVTNTLHTKMYANPSAFHDITAGNNGAYLASSGWDACTGMGSPNGTSILGLLGGGSSGGTSPTPPTTSATAPTAAFVGTPTRGNKVVAVQFTDQSEGTPTSWQWIFGDGTTSTVQNPKRSYARGTYKVTLTVRNAKGTSSITKNSFISVT